MPEDVKKGLLKKSDRHELVERRARVLLYGDETYKKTRRGHSERGGFLVKL